MAQSLTDIRSAYDQAASAYAAKFLDELRHKPRDRELLQRFASIVGRGGGVLDLGCGPGHTTAYLAGLGLRPTGVDLSPGMIAKARAHFADISFTVGSFFELAAADESVPGVLALYCIVHLERNQIQPAFREMLRVLKPGGVLLLSFHIGSEPVYVEDFLESGAKLDFFPFPVADVESALVSAGFIDLDIIERPPYDTEYPTTRCYILAHKPAGP